MQTLLAVAAGGAVGAASRYLLSVQIARWFGTAFPWGTLACNVIGALLMGLLVGISARVWPIHDPWRALLTTGILGGFTTFSTFSLEAALFVERGQPLMALLYAVVSVVLCLVALLGALWLTRALPAGLPS